MVNAQKLPAGLEAADIGLDLMTEYLNTQGLCVVIAQSGEEALQQAELVRPDAIKHARASRVTLTVRSDDRGTRLEVSDKSCEITQVPGQRQGLGLHTMLHRAESIGATLQLLATPGEGTTVVCDVPMVCAL